MLKVGTLFSGGLAALEWAIKYEGLEHEVVFACEWDKYARKQYLEFHGEPTSNFYEDVSDMNGTKYKDSIDYKIAGNGIEINTIRSIVRALYKPVSKKDTLF